VGRSGKHTILEKRRDGHKRYGWFIVAHGLFGWRAYRTDKQGNRTEGISMDYRKKQHLHRLIDTHKPLGSKSLKAVWEWTEENEEHPLSQAYYGACNGIGNYQTWDIQNSLKDTWRGNKIGRIRAARKPVLLGYIYRDEIGRMILRMLKKQSQNREA
jgi:hypothetical protein